MLIGYQLLLLGGNSQAEGAFQVGAFQKDAFQIDAVGEITVSPVGISWSTVTPSLIGGVGFTVSPSSVLSTWSAPEPTLVGIPTSTLTTISNSVVVLKRTLVHSELTNNTMTDKLTSLQELFSMSIPANTLTQKKLRLRALLSRVKGELEVCCFTCTDDIPPTESQELVETDMYDVSEINVTTSWAYVGPGPEMYILLADDSCGGGNAHYDTCTDLIHILNGVKTVRNDLKPEVGNYPAVNNRIGHSDEHSYVLQTTSSFGTGLHYYSIPNQTLTVCKAQSGDIGMQVTAWSKYGNSIYACINQTAFGNSKRVREFDATTGAHIRFTDVLQTYSSIQTIQANSTYLYGLAHKTSETDKIVRISLSDFSTVEVIDTGLTFISAFYVVNDNLVYFIRQVLGLPSVGVYCWNGSEIITVDSSVTISNGAHGSDGQLGLHFINRTLFYGSDADEGIGADVNISVIEVDCE